MKVLFAGTAGVRKYAALKNLFVAAKRLFPEERIFTKVAGQPEQIPIIDHLIYGRQPLTFLKLDQDQQRRRWREHFNKLLDQFARTQGDHHFFGLHFIYRYRQVPISAADFKVLVDWKPDCIITFIDDIYCVRDRIHSLGHISFTLAELIIWRAEEILVGDLLARAVNPHDPPPHYVVAVQHPAAMLARLLFNPDTARIYISHDISNARWDERLRDIIDGFRTTIRSRQNCAVFEPLTIDEFPPELWQLPNKQERIEAWRTVVERLETLRESPNKEEQKQHNLHHSLVQEELLRHFSNASSWSSDQLKQNTLSAMALESLHSAIHTNYNPSDPSARWPVLISETLLASYEDLHLPIRIPSNELEGCKEGIRAQIRDRDMRLVEQAHYVVVYRPTIAGGSGLTTGVNVEVEHARHTGRPVIWYIKRGTDHYPTSPMLETPTQDPDIFFEESEERFWTKIDSLRPYNLG